MSFTATLSRLNGSRRIHRRGRQLLELAGEEGTRLLDLPLQSSAFDAVLDRGCFHYLEPGDRPGYAAEVSRIVKPGGKLLLRPSLRAAGVRNDIDEQVIRRVFGRWHIQHMTRATVPSEARRVRAMESRVPCPPAELARGAGLGGSSMVGPALFTGEQPAPRVRPRCQAPGSRARADERQHKAVLSVA
jgi:SAM-dependent methyltransferase